MVQLCDLQSPMIWWAGCMLLAPTCTMLVFLLWLRNVWLSIIVFHVLCCLCLPLWYLGRFHFYHGSAHHKTDVELASFHQMTGHDPDNGADDPSANLLSNTLQSSTVSSPVPIPMGMPMTVLTPVSLVRARRHPSRTDIVESAARDAFVRSLRFDDLRQQCLVGTSICAACILLGVGLYLVCSPLVPNVSGKTADYELDNRSPYPFILFTLYFTLVNPICEEFFWRAFAQFSFGTSRTCTLIQISCYAMYHVVVLIVFLPLWLTVFCTIGVFSAGCTFTFLYRRWGPVCAAIAHSGADFVVMVILSNMYFSWAP
eukprot:ANDGO_04072.mRNA.1 hypothetical protein DICPUDRAFT_83629